MDVKQFATACASASSTVFVVIDDRQTREALAVLIQASGWRAETFPSAREFLARATTASPTCVLLDVFLPDLNGLEVQKRLAVERPEIAVVFVTECGDVATSVQAMKSGASDFLTKPVDGDALVMAIQQALDHSRRKLERMEETRAISERYASLTPRERQVMALVASGLLNKQVGGELGITEITVKAHRGQVMRKMRADSLVALVRMSGSLCLRSNLADTGAFRDLAADRVQQAYGGVASRFSESVCPRRATHAHVPPKPARYSPLTSPIPIEL
jgi:FixJ family two-component response regulator